jgi:heme/copper-type cytochrome/quinol oxidase subunit 3
MCCLFPEQSNHEMRKENAHQHNFRFLLLFKGFVTILLLSFVSFFSCFFFCFTCRNGTTEQRRPRKNGRKPVTPLPMTTPLVCTSTPSAAAGKTSSYRLPECHGKLIANLFAMRQCRG